MAFINTINRLVQYTKEKPDPEGSGYVWVWALTACVIRL